MKNSKKVQSKKTKEIFNFTINSNWSKELKIFKDVLANNRNKTKTFSELLNEAISLRNNSTYDLKPYNELAIKVKQNFTNRLARFIGGSLKSAEIKPSKQAKYFNIEVQSGQICVFSQPIDPSRNISPQVKDGRTIKLPRRNLVPLNIDISIEDIESDVQ